uniref:AT11374p n=1 Tax=Drosophila melanogaster TaxID=7227 RepID=Q8T4H1_DROME
MAGIKAVVANIRSKEDTIKLLLRKTKHDSRHQTSGENCDEGVRYQRSIDRKWIFNTRSQCGEQSAKHGNTYMNRK